MAIVKQPLNQALVYRWIVLSITLLGVLIGGNMPAQAGKLDDRLTQFPNWRNKPPVYTSKTELTYPAWMAGHWIVTSTLVDMVAPLAPKITTPGFEGNRRYLNQPMRFQVRFVKPSQPMTQQAVFPFPNLTMLPTSVTEQPQVVADRVFNGLNLAKAYLGEQTWLTVEADPQSPNRQVTQLKGGIQLISTVTAQASETLPDGQFVATEISQQFFRGQQPSYLNEVEVTTRYRQTDGNSNIQADQMTAIYLSPKDPNYFRAGLRPVALYRYQLRLQPYDLKDPS